MHKLKLVPTHKHTLRVERSLCGENDIWFTCVYCSQTLVLSRALYKAMRAGRR